MARKVFFSFDYRDFWRANIVRNSASVDAVLPAGFHDTSVWEEANRVDELRMLIDRSLDGTTVTAVLIGAQTANRQYVTYEIERSIAQGNVLLGIRIDKIKDRRGAIDGQGPIPSALVRVSAPIFEWQDGRLGDWIEVACRQKYP